MKVHCNGIEVNYEVCGAGPWVVLAHSLGSDLTIWSAQAEVLAKAGHAVLRYDIRGHGGSTASDGPYDFALLAADALALLDALGIARASFVGISLGGMIAQAIALAAPQRIERLVLADTTSRYPPEAQAVWPERIRQVEAAGTAPLVAPTLERWFTAAFRAAQAEITAAVGACIAATPVAGYVGCCHAIAGLDFADRLAAIRQPALVLVGEHDQGTPLPMAEALARGIPDARLVVVPGAAHLGCVEQPGHFSRLLQEFLAEPAK